MKNSEFWDGYAQARYAIRMETASTMKNLTERRRLLG